MECDIDGMLDREGSASFGSEGRGLEGLYREGNVIELLRYSRGTRACNQNDSWSCKTQSWLSWSSLRSFLLAVKLHGKSEKIQGFSLCVEPPVINICYSFLKL